MSKFKRIAKSVVSVLLAVIFCSQTLYYAKAAENAVTTVAETALETAKEEAAKSNLYVKEVKIGYKNELEECGYTVIDSYINCQPDDPKFDWVPKFRLGYKTTENKDEAVTDIALLGTNDGFAKLDVKEQIDSEKSGVADLVALLKSASLEYKANLEKGSATAKLTEKALNCFYVPGENGKSDMSLSEYITSDKVTEDEFVTLIMIGAENLEYILVNQLSLAVCDDMSKEGATSWLDRLAKAEPYVFKDNDGNVLTDKDAIAEIYETKYDTKYSAKAKRLYIAIGNFADSYKKALSHYPDGKVPQLNDAEINAVYDEISGTSASDEINLDNITVKSTDVISTSDAQTVNQQKVRDAIALTIYNSLNEKNDKGEYKYSYGKKSDGSARSITDFFTEIVAMDVKSESANPLEVYRLLYPLLENQDGTRVLTDGQTDILYLAGFEMMILKASLKPEDYKEVETRITKAQNSLTEIFNGPMSVWYGVNKAAYENQKGVYYTTRAYRKDAAAQIANEILKPEKTNTELTKSQKVDAVVSIIEMASTVLSVSSQLASAILSTVSTITFDKAVETLGLFVTKVATGYTVAASVTCVVVNVISVVTTVVAVLTIFMGLVSYLIYSYDESLDYKDYDYNSIPEVVYDFNDNNIKLGAALDYYAVRYVGENYNHNYGFTEEFPEGVSKQTAPYYLYFGSGKIVDIDQRIINNIYKSEHMPKMQVWLVLYYTTNKNAGNPITVAYDENGNDITFVSKKNDHTIPDGYTGLHSFGSEYARDLSADLGTKAGQYKDFPYQYYWFMHREPNKTDDETNGKYIADVCMVSYSGNQSTAAKYELEGQGYKVIERNLTQHSMITTYIGYKTTDLESNAVTDIRFAYNPGVNPKAGSLYYGSNKYTASGSAGMLTLFITKNNENYTSTAGTPILAEGFDVYYKKSDVPEGYEPVNLFSGGPALDLNLGGSWGYTNTGIPKSEQQYYNDTVYLYFQPSKKYTSGDEYIGGLSFFTGYDVEAYAEELGWTVLDSTDLSGHEYSMVLPYRQNENAKIMPAFRDDTVTEETCKTILAYTTTYNPYRAVYDIKTYTCEPNTTQPNYCINYGGLGYCAADVYVNGAGSRDTVEYYDVENPDYNYKPTNSSASDDVLKKYFKENVEHANVENYLSRDNRTLRYSHSFRSKIATEGGFEPYSLDYKTDAISACVIEKVKSKAEVRITDDGKIILSDITPMALYVLGCNVSDFSKAAPIKVSELVVQHSTTYEGTANDVTPVKDFTDAYGTEATDLASADILTDDAKFMLGLEIKTHFKSYAAWEKLGKFLRDATKVYDLNTDTLALFILRKDVKKGKYVKSVQVVYAGNGQKTKDENGNDKTEEIKTPVDHCKYELLANGAGELVKVNLSSDATTDSISDEVSAKCSAIYQLYKTNRRSSEMVSMSFINNDYDVKNRIYSLLDSGKYGCQSTDYGDEFAYVYITYTNAKSKALSDLYIASSDVDFQDDTQNKGENASKLGKSMRLSNGAEVNVCGDGFRVNGTGKYYYIYSLSGSGNEITDIVFDHNVYIDGYTTCLSTDMQASDYTRFFIHTKHYATGSEKNYMVAAEAAGGKTLYDAQIALLNIGCQSASSKVILHSTGEYTVFGIKKTRLKDKAFTGLILENLEQDKTVEKLLVGRDSYFKTGLNVNASAAYDSIVALFATTSVRKAHENGDEAHYVTDFMFWTSTELLDCFKSEDDEEVKQKLDKYLATLSEDDANYLRSYVYETTRDSNGNEDIHVVKWDVVRNSDDDYMNCSYGNSNFVSKNAKTNEVYMYVRYTDNYVRNDDLEDEGSFFGNTGTVVSVSGALLLLLLAGAYLIVKKKKENLAAK